MNEQRRLRRAEKICECAERGMTRQEAAQDLGWCYHTVVRYALEFDIEFVRQPGSGGGTVADTERAAAMESMYRAGKTLQEIGSIYNLTRERVRQIIHKHYGLSAQDGGAVARAKRTRAKQRRERNAKCMKSYGCDYATLRKMRRLGRKLSAQGVSRERTPLGAFARQRCSAGLRGIEWKLLFWEWWTIWQESGHWEQRGRTRGDYVMCRFGDTGAYEVGNVYIATVSHNLSVQPNNPYRKGHPLFEKTTARRSKARARFCEVDDCDEAHYAHGVCRRHYNQAQKLISKPRPEPAGASQ